MSVRIDKWLWAARFFRTRAAAQQAVEGGKVKLNGERTKPAKELRVGDRLLIHAGVCEWEIAVEQLSALRGSAPICSFWLSQDPGETLDEAIRCARGLGATLIRLHLTPVLEGPRASLGPRWQQMVNHARRTLEREAPRVAAAGLTMAIENHQDFGSEELVALAEALGDHVGIVFDTGNPFSVAEDPVAFARRAAHRIRHVHLKDYVAQFTEDGYRLIRCAIGDGAVPFLEIDHMRGTIP